MTNSNNFGSKKKRWKAKFGRPLADYTPQFCPGVKLDSALRTLKRWISEGKKANALPPLDDPPEMLGWWQSVNHKRPPPAVLYALATGGNDITPLNLEEIRGLTPQENVENIRRNLAIVERRLRNAIERNDEGEIAIQQRNYKEIAEIWRRAEVSLGEIEKASGESLPKSTVEAGITRSLQMLRLMRERMPRDILIDLETTVPRRLSRIWAALKPHLERSIQKVRETEEDIFRKL